MPNYRRVGDVPPKRHTQVYQPKGTLVAEELIGRNGFAEESCLLYHRNPPTDVRATEAVGHETAEGFANHPLMPYLISATTLTPNDGDAVWGRRTVFMNADVSIGVAPVGKTSELYRNARGDELLFMLRGSARLDTVFGSLNVVSGDYVVVPKATIHQWVPVSEPGALLLTIESSGAVLPPSRYLSTRGQFLETSPYCERDLHGPTSPLIAQAEGPAAVVTKSAGGFTRHTMKSHPFDVVGWDGCLYPYKINIADFEPITGRIHQPPPVHQMFEAPGMVVCSFVPRKLDYHPDAIPAPYHHSNTDSDEVLVYFDGEFLSRGGVDIASGSMTLHPAGMAHGPQPGSVEASLGAETTDETAVMIDTFAPLGLTTHAKENADADYHNSWNNGEPQ